MGLLSFIDADPKKYLGVVVIPTYGFTRSFPSLILRLSETLPKDFAIVVLEDNSSESFQIEKFLNEKCAEIEVDLIYGKNFSNLGFVNNVNQAFDKFPNNDIVLCNSDVIPAFNWFEVMHSLAKSDSAIASVTAPTNSGSIATVTLAAKTKLPDEIDQIAEIRSNFFGFNSEIPVAVGHFMYINSIALQKVGKFDSKFSPGYGEEVDWSIRASALGFLHLLANQTFVYHENASSFKKIIENGNDDFRLRNESYLIEKYPDFPPVVDKVQSDIYSDLNRFKLLNNYLAGDLTFAIDLISTGKNDITELKFLNDLTSLILKTFPNSKIRAVVNEIRNLNPLLNSANFSITLYEDQKSFNKADVVISFHDNFDLLDLLKLQLLGKRKLIFYSESLQLRDTRIGLENLKSGDFFGSIIDEAVSVHKYLPSNFEGADLLEKKEFTELFNQLILRILIKKGNQAFDVNGLLTTLSIFEKELFLDKLLINRLNLQVKNLEAAQNHLQHKFEKALRNPFFRWRNSRIGIFIFPRH